MKSKIRRLSARWPFECPASMLAVAVAVAVAVAGVVASACQAETGDSPSVQGETVAFAGEGQHTIRVDVTSRGTRRRVEFAPLDSRSWRVTRRSDSRVASETAATELRAPSSRVMVTGETGTVDQDGGVAGASSRDFTDEEEKLGHQPGWLITNAALWSCFYDAYLDGKLSDDYKLETITEGEGMTIFLAALTAFVGLPPDDPWLDAGGVPAWFAFNYKPLDSCPMQLHHEELLLCAADKIASVADSVTTERWRYLTFSGSEREMVEWSFPPQMESDRFILRDVAIHTLAQVALLDVAPLNAIYSSEWSGDLAPETSCWSALGRLAGEDVPTEWTVNGELSDEYATKLIERIPGAAQGLNLSTTVYVTDGASDEEQAISLLSARTHVLRTAGRLLRSLVDASFYSDLAGAEARRNAAGDPARGLASAWGVDDEIDGAYNSMRHVLRLLMGRWEFGPNYELTDENGDPLRDRPVAEPGEPKRPVEAPDSWCAGVKPLDLLAQSDGSNSSLGSWVSARWADLPVSTSGQSLALTTLLGAGIILPSGVEVGIAREAIREQLMLSAFLGWDGFGDDDCTTELPAQWADADALENDCRFKLFADGPMGQAIADVVREIDAADLRFAIERTLDYYRLLTGSDGLSPIAASAGVVSEAGVALSPTLASAGGFAIAGGFPTGALTTDAFAWLGGAQERSQCLSFDDPTGTAPDRYSIFQNVFALGDVFRRGVAETAALDVGSPDLKRLASLAAAELKTWTAEGRIVYGKRSERSQGLWSLLGTYLDLDLIDFDPEAFGLNAESISNNTELRTALSGRLALIRGEPWAADCLAGLRAICPATLPDRIVLPAPTIVDSAYEGKTYSWSVRLAGPFGVSLSGPGRDYLVVLPRDNESGRVLATLRRPASGENISEVVSSYQRELLNKAFAIGSRWADHIGEIGAHTTGHSDSYCMEGVPRDFFVPLQNELTGDGSPGDSSWSHYLALADKAATEADQLGQELIARGETRELRREQAGYKLAQSCGDFSVLGGISAEGGKVDAGDADAELTACLNEPTVDLVFTSTTPFEGLSAEKSTEIIKSTILGCEAEGETGGADDPLCDKEIITHDALGLVDLSDNGLTEEADCVRLRLVSKLLNLGGGDSAALAASNMTHASYASQSGLILTLSALKLVDDSSGGWQLLQYGRPVLGSAPTLYPGCACSGTTCDSDLGSCADEEWAGVMANYFPAGSGDSAAAVFKVRQDVLGAILMMAHGSGYLPPGVIDTYIPAANVAGLPDDALVNPLTLYGSGEFVGLQGEYWLVDTQDARVQERVGAGEYLTDLGSDVYGEDRAIVGAASKIPPEHVDLWSGGQWGPLVSIYSRNVEPYIDDLGKYSPPYVWVHAKNSEWQGSGLLDDSTAQRLIDALSFGVHHGTGAMEELQQFNCPTFERDGWDTLLNAVFERGDGWYDGSVDVRHRVPNIPEHWIDKWELSLAAYLSESGAYPTWDERRWSTSLAGREVCEHSSRFTASIPAGCITDLAYRNGTNQGGVRDAEGESLWWEKLLETAEADGWSELVSELEKRSESGFFIAHEYSLPVRASLPRVCPPDERVLPAVVPTSLEKTDALLALGLACEVSRSTADTLGLIDPPPVEKEQDLDTLQIWMNLQSQQLETARAVQIFRGMPATVVAAMKIGTDQELKSQKGTRGQQLYELQNMVEELNRGWRDASAAFGQLGNQVSMLRTNIALARIRGKRDLTRNAIAQGQNQIGELGLERELVELDRQAALGQIKVARSEFQAAMGAFSGITGALGSAATGNPLGVLGGYGQAMSSMQNMMFDKQEAATKAKFDAAARDNVYKRMGVYGDIQNLLEGDSNDAAKEAITTVQQAIAQYAINSADVHQGLSAAVSRISVAGNRVRSLLLGLDLSRNNARYDAAVAAGDDFFETDDGTRVAIPVNTVQRRLYDITKLRYDSALKDAKRLGYMARLSIEQRIGVRLDEISQEIGSLSPPELWADAICTATGVDYDALSTADLTDDRPSSERWADEQADYAEVVQSGSMFVGDYVDRLQKFVEFYNVAYPFKEGDDVALVSLRDDLLPERGLCVAESPNMLRFSDELWRSDAAGGWKVRECLPEYDKCLSVRPASALNDTTNDPALWTPPLPPAGYGDVTWLVEKPFTTLYGNATTLPTPDDIGVRAAPGSVVTQSVVLRAGVSYVLSWWDMARETDGSPKKNAPTVDDAYRVEVLDDEWSRVGWTVEVPHQGTSNGSGFATWSPRRKLRFTPARSGTHVLALGPSLPGIRRGSLAIANVQLEEAEETDLPVAYEAVSSSRLQPGTTCMTESSAIWQDAFEYGCESNGQCYWELSEPFMVDTTSINKMQSPLVGKVAVGNYNFRHSSLAVNVVGTGVNDCSGLSQSCYGDGYLEYTFEHSAFGVPVIDYEQNERRFNFGNGSITRGKALAAERWVTLPISSTDQGYLQQPEFTKRELAGRPLSGIYRLRIYDRPSLRWENVEDIQLVLGYRYWSRVAGTASN